MEVVGSIFIKYNDPLSLMKSTISVVICAGLPHERVLIRLQPPPAPRKHIILRVVGMKKPFSQCINLSLIYGLIALIGEAFVGLVNKYKTVMNEKGCTFLRTYVTNLAWQFFNQIKANSVVMIWHTWNMWLTWTSPLALINFPILSH